MDKRKFAIGMTGAALGLTGIGVWYSFHHTSKSAPKMLYVSNGYGGFVPTSPAAPQHAAIHPEKKPADPIPSMVADYNAGRYQSVEATAVRVMTRAQKSHSNALRKQAAQASSLLAYSAARRHDMKLAQVRFAAARFAAAHLPDKGKQPAVPGMITPTLEEDAAYEHAVCTASLGDMTAAEAEYIAFMQKYPESPLVQASIKRIERLHGGDAPPIALAAWREAQRIATAHEKSRAREAALCGPECLAELLRRGGVPHDVHTLASAMGTSDQGTTVKSLADAAQRNGFQPTGLALTMPGLTKQKLPVIALIAPGHYVIVDGVTSSAVTYWDPDANGTGRSAQHIAPIAQWTAIWSGVTLALGSVSSVRASTKVAQK